MLALRIGIAKNAALPHVASPHALVTRDNCCMLLEAVEHAALPVGSALVGLRFSQAACAVQKGAYWLP
jgi:hypothetical protein